MCQHPEHEVPFTINRDADEYLCPGCGHRVPLWPLVKLQRRKETKIFSTVLTSKSTDGYSDSVRFDSTQQTERTEMAMAFAVESKRGKDTITFLPQDLDCTGNSRLQAHTDEQIAILAQNILDNGQLQPALVRRLGDKTVKVIAGHGRARAVQYINEVLRPTEEPRRLVCTVVDCSPEEAFVRSLAENLQRANTTPLDDAHAQRKLREEYQWTDARIAEFYQKSVSYVGQLRKVHNLSASAQQLIQDEKLAINAAIDLAELPEEQVPAVIQGATRPDGSVDTEAVRKHVREHKNAAGKGGKPRSVKEIKGFLVEVSDKSEAIKKVAQRFVEFINGKIGERAMASTLEEFVK